jgi:predicted ABC-type transport system involved in lysophospholipase L1 biosynthesis ATPase subunit
VFQTFNLISSLTALENVEMPMILANKLSRSERRARAKGEPSSYPLLPLLLRLRFCRALSHLHP